MLLPLLLTAADAAPVRVVDVGWAFVSVFALDAGDGVVLVDTHYPGKADKVLRRLERAGIDPDRIELVVLTHSHADHVGSAGDLRERLGVPVVAGAGDEPQLASGEMGELHFTGPTGKMASVVIKKHFPPLVPDLVVSDRLDLAAYGIPGEVRHVGGHTAGSLVVTLPDGVVLIGDLVRSRLLRRHAPQVHFVQEDPVAAHRVLDELVDEGFTTFWPSHGGPLEAERLERWLAGKRVRQEQRAVDRVARDQSRSASR